MSQTREHLPHEALDMALLEANLAGEDRGQLVLNELEDQVLDESVWYFSHATLWALTRTSHDRQR